jgi:carboxypeptidase PM20D1
LSKVYGEVVSVPGIMIAASDTRHYSKVADNSFRFNPFSIVPEDMTGFHGTNESIAALIVLLPALKPMLILSTKDRATN